MYGFAVKFGQNVAALEACLGGRRSGPHVGEPYSIGEFGEIGNAAEIRAVSAARYFAGMRIGDLAGRLRLRHPHELRARRVIDQVAGDIGDQIQQPDGVGSVDFVPGVAGLVIIGVQAGEEEQHRDLFGGERGVVARSVAGLLA